MHLEMIRRSLHGKGLTPASAVPELSGGLLEEPSIIPARLLEGLELLAIGVGAPVPWPDPVAYLDGVQRSELVGYLGSSPLLIAEIAAAVRERREGYARYSKNSGELRWAGRPCWRPLVIRWPSWT
jgi:hypothetical protein